MKTLFRGGYIYSPVPEATALLVEDDKIVWVGDDAAAAAYLESDTRVVELDGAFVAPPFIDMAAGQVEALGCAFGTSVEATDSEGTAGPIYWSAEPSDPVLTKVVTSTHSGTTQRVVCLDPVLASTARALANAGVPYCFGSWGKYASPWQWVALATGTADEPGLSERAAFLAATRGPLRVFSERNWTTDGLLDGSSSADFAIWRADNIDVRAPDTRIAAWSTDPRSGVPGLPQVSVDGPFPEFQAMYLAGQEVST